MQPESAKYLRDMLDAGVFIAEQSQGKSAEDYEQQRPLRDAIHWNFAVIGEALSQLSKQDPGTAQQITEWSRIIEQRDHLEHHSRETPGSDSRAQAVTQGMTRISPHAHSGAPGREQITGSDTA
jgi:uncharacterized protein with HEPN domain